MNLRRRLRLPGHLLALPLLAVLSFSPHSLNPRPQLAKEISFSIKNQILKPWYPLAVDRQYGGFLSTFTYDFEPTGPQDKMVVTQARHTWSNARAAQLYPEEAHYKTSAAHGYRFLRDVLWDKTHGGFYTLVNRQGQVKENPAEPKNAYGNAFALYALAAYYQATGDTAALNLAKKTFWWLEQHSHDPEHNGYFQALQRDGTPIRRHSGLPSTSEVGYKDQNSSIHLLEALTELYFVWPEPLVRERLEEMLVLIRDTITTPRGHMALFFTPDWRPVSYRDSSETLRSRHHNLDHVSFGHDVETAFLLLEASHALGLKQDPKTHTVAKRMVDHTLRTGWDPTKGGFYDAGYYLPGQQTITITKKGKNWWSQAEGMNTLLLMADLYPKDEHRYLKRFEQLWAYVKQYVIDQEHGGWFEYGLDTDPERKTALKGHIWKGNYHQFRALMHCLHRLQPDKQAPAVPTQVKFKQRANVQVLEWQPAQDDHQLLGYNIYRNGTKIGFTPLTSFTLPSGVKSGPYTVRAVDAQGNESKDSKQVRG